MAFAISGANAAFNDFGAGISGRSVQNAAEPFPVLRIRQNTTAPVGEDTINIFVDGLEEDYKYAASIVTACGGSTIMEYRCTDGGRFVGSATCGPNGILATATVAPNTLIFSSATTVGKTSATVVEACTVTSSAATCSVTIGGTVDGTKATTSTTITNAGSSFYLNQVSITAGAEKTASAASACETKKSAGATLSAKSVMVVGLVGVAGILSLF